MESLPHTERFYDEEYQRERYNSLLESAKHVSGEESCDESGVSTNTDEVLRSSGCDASGENQHLFCCADTNTLGYKEVFYGAEDGDVVQSNGLSHFGCEEEVDPESVDLLEYGSSRANQGEGISEIVERFIATIPQHIEKTPSFVLIENADPHDAQSGEQKAGTEKVTLLAENLEKIVTNFKKCHKSCDRFRKMYPVWNSNRRKIITELKEIADILDKLRLECNIAKIIAAAGGTFGSTLSVVGAGLMPFTLGLSAALMVAGCAITLTGGSTALGTAVAEVVLLQKQVEAVQKLLKRDEHFFQHLHQLLQHASDYIDSVNEAFDFDIFTQFLTDLKRVFSVFSAAAKEKAMGDAIASLLKSTLKDLPMSLAVGIEVAKSRKFAELLKELIVLHHDNPVVFESLAMTTRIFLEIGRAAAEVPGSDVVVGVTDVAKVGTTTFKATLHKALSQGILAAVGLALDLTSLILTSIDMHNGSKCPKAKEVREISEKLSNEFDLVKRIYSELKKSQLL